MTTVILVLTFPPATPELNLRCSFMRDNHHELPGHTHTSHPLSLSERGTCFIDDRSACFVSLLPIYIQGTTPWIPCHYLLPRSVSPLAMLLTVIVHLNFSVIHDPHFGCICKIEPIQLFYQSSFFRSTLALGTRSHTINSNQQYT